MTLAEAIASFEGFGKPGTLATVNNNPGNLVFNDYTESLGAIGSYKGFAVFPDVATGMDAQNSLLQSYANHGYSVGDGIARWNGNGSNTPAYQDYVASKTGLSLTDKMKAAIGAVTGIAGKNPASVAGDVGGMLDYKIGTSSVSKMIWGVSWTRLAAFLLGLICVIIGLVGFKPVNDVVVSIKDKAVDAAKTAAVVAA